MDARKQNIEVLARNVLSSQVHALGKLDTQLNISKILEVVDLILGCQNMIWVTGAGTSSSIGRRLAHTLTCVGARSAFLDPGQAQHGYSAILREGDLLIAFSRGGESDEVNTLIGIACEYSVQVISILGDRNSPMAEMSDIILEAYVSPEDEVLNYIPLSSTHVQAALGDILCAAVASDRGFSEEEFGTFHPGGSVGKRLAKSE